MGRLLVAVRRALVVALLVLAVNATGANASPASTAPPSPASTPSATAHAAASDDALHASDPAPLAPRAEPAFVVMVMVVVFLSVLRAGFQLRDAADARSEESVTGGGL